MGAGQGFSLTNNSSSSHFCTGPPRNRNPMGNLDDDGDGMPSNWDPRNARRYGLTISDIVLILIRSDDEERIHRQQVSET